MTNERNNTDPIRPRLAAFRPDTEARIINWALRQPADVRARIMSRINQYTSAGHAFSPRLDATSALDVMRSLYNKTDDRGTIEQFDAFHHAATGFPAHP